MTEASELKFKKLIPQLTPKGFNTFGDIHRSEISAICEAIDNPVEEYAQSIAINIKDDLSLLTVVDRGSGMTQADLANCVDIGADSGKSNRGWGGRGIGLKTSFATIGHRLDIFTSSDGSEVLHLIMEIKPPTYDADGVPSYEEPLIGMQEASAQERNRFFEYLDKLDAMDKMNNFERDAVRGRGTVLNISNTRNFSMDHRSLVLELRNKVSQKYRSFIDDGLRIYINDDVPLVSVSPLAGSGDILLNEERVYKDNHRVRIIAKHLDSTSAGSHNRLCTENQGVYFLRNRNEVGTAQAVGRDKHNSFNGFRVEVYYTGTLDAEVSVLATKDHVRLSLDFQQWLAAIILPLMTQSKTLKEGRANAKRAAKEAAATVSRGTPSPQQIQQIRKSIEQELLVDVKIQAAIDSGVIAPSYVKYLARRLSGCVTLIP